MTTWVEETIEHPLTFFRLPRQHHKHLKFTNMLERLNEEITRRTYVVRIFPNSESCLRLVRALAVETNENWMEANRYIATSTWTTCASTSSSLCAMAAPFAELDAHNLILQQGRSMRQHLHMPPGFPSHRACSVMAVWLIWRVGTCGRGLPFRGGRPSEVAYAATRRVS
ncbi:transposase [Mesorhizobium sp. NZP2077]|uniref:transposase n=1 Tax=Mesorhizobium sp. NZP2077 TaxID=2483404 RepID=UPI0032B16EB3